MNINTT